MIDDDLVNFAKLSKIFVLPQHLLVDVKQQLTLMITRFLVSKNHVYKNVEAQILQKIRTN